MFDKNGNGTISAKELGSALETVGLKQSDAEVQGLLRSVDKNGKM